MGWLQCLFGSQFNASSSKTQAVLKLPAPDACPGWAVGDDLASSEHEAAAVAPEGHYRGLGRTTVGGGIQVVVHNTAKAGP